MVERVREPASAIGAPVEATPDLFERLADLVAAARSKVTPPERPLLAGLAGSVAVGKSMLAARLAERLSADGMAVEVVGTDGFLLPNAVLAERGLLLQKGFPPSYDADAIERFCALVRTGVVAEVPVYDHATYDHVPGAIRRVHGADVVLVEGVNALQLPFRSALDLAIYIDADEADIERWFVERFLDLCRDAENDETSFYRLFVEHDATGRLAAASAVWGGVNLVNLRNHILPCRVGADVVVRKGSTHEIVALEVR